MAYAVLILIPLAAAALIAFFESRTRTAIRAIAFLATLTCLVATSYLVYANAIGKIPVVDFEWLPLLGSYLYFKASGLALSLILLTSLLALLAVIGSFNLSIENEKLYYSMLLILFSSLFGVFLARDFLLFYLFWEAVLIPMYFLIGIFGSENRRYAATKFFIYTFVASILMLIGIFIVSTVSPTLKFEDLIASASQLSYDKRLIAFALIFLGFAVKLPTFPLHTWLPDAHVQAPTQASVLLAGILLKMGGYGLFELLGPMFPDLINEYARLFLGLAAVSVIYGALTAYAQKDAKKLVAYSSIAHMGFVTAAFSAYNHAGSKTAAGFVMWAHGLITGMLFFLVGLIYERFHSRDLDVIKHLAIRYPQLGWSVVFASLASLGLPGLAGFIGEFMTSSVLYEAFGFLALSVIAGVFLNATYSLKLVRKIAITPVGVEEEKPRFLADLPFNEKFVIWVFVIGIVLSGVFPQIIIKIMEKA